MSLRGIGLSVSILGGLVLGACSSSEPPQAMPETQAPPQYDYTTAQLQTLPTFEVGDSFRFDSPDVVWRVTGVEDDKIVMVSETGARQVRPKNPLLPNIEWSNKTHGTGKRLITNKRGSLFPLAVGNRLTFRSTVDTDKPPYAWEYDWSCEVMSRQKTIVPAGEFDTFKVDCKRREREVISIYYAPMVGYAVRFDNTNPGSGAVNSNKLVGYQRGDTVMGQIVPAKTTPPKSAMPETTMMKDEAKAAPEKVMPAPEEKPATEPKMAAGEAKKKAEPSGAAMLHLASYKKSENLEPSWTRLQKKYRSELKGLSHSARPVNIPGKGKFTRLLAGPVSDSKEANRLCRQLKAKGQYCAVMAR